MVTGTTPISQLPTGSAIFGNDVFPYTHGITGAAAPQTQIASFALMQSTLGTNLGNGWATLPASLVFVSADSPSFVITANANITGSVGLGSKIQLTHQSAQKNFIVTQVKGVTGSTTYLNLYGGTDYTLNLTGAITNPMYSNAKSPVGFPLSPAKWTVSFAETTDRSQASPVIGTWYNLGSISISVPIGAWKLLYMTMAYADKSVAGTLDLFSTLSTTTNGETNTDLTRNWLASSLVTVVLPLGVSDYTLSVTTKTTYYLNGKTGRTEDNIIFGNKLISLECAYL